jgi:thiamine-phosphate pyrophosphorylase
VPDAFSPLYAIVDVDSCVTRGLNPRELTRALLAGGATLFQLRAKGLGSGAFLDLAQALVRDIRTVSGRLIINDRADICALAGAHGVHVGQEDLAPAEAGRIAGADAIVGLSTHTETQLDRALGEAISYVAVGPVFGTTTKDTGYERVGLELVRNAVQRLEGRLPVVAIGGITLATAREVIEAGAASVAVISDLLVADPERRAREYLKALA